MALRRELEEFGIFSEYGVSSLVVDIDASNAEKALKAYQSWLDKIEEIAQRF